MNEVAAFREIVWEHYRDAHRDLPWRTPDQAGIFDPYKILVSEIMLQQTQVSRVIPKYEQFLANFPSVSELAMAQLSDVLRAWNGLGYNRRAKYLWEAAQYVMNNHDGIFPETVDELVKLPGVGRNTAGALMAYAHNAPVSYIETNIRTVFIHHFFPSTTGVTDSDLMPFIELAIDTEHPREWYWALMDYGVFLKRTHGNASRSSKHYTKQSVFNGSRRQVRGRILKLLTTRIYTYDELKTVVDDDRFEAVLTDLINESLITQNGQEIRL